MPLRAGSLGFAPGHKHHRLPTPPRPAPSPRGEPVAPKRPSPVPWKASVSCSRHVSCSHQPRKASVPSSRLHLLPPRNWAPAQQPHGCSRAPPEAPELPLGHLQLLPSSATFSLSLSLSLSLPHLRTRAKLPSPILHPSQLVPRVRGSRGYVNGSRPCTSPASSLSTRLKTSASAPLGQLPLASLPSALAPLSQLPLASSLRPQLPSASSPRPCMAPVSSSCRLPSASVPLGQLWPAPLGLSSPRPAPLGLVWLPSPAPTDSPRPQLPLASSPRPRTASISSKAAPSAP